MKSIVGFFSICLLALSACSSTRKLYDLKDKDLSAPVQNAARVCNMLTWVYNTCSDYDDMAETLKEIGIGRQELETMRFSGNYEKPFGRHFSLAPNYSDESRLFALAKKQARKIAALILKKLPKEDSEK